MQLATLLAVALSLATSEAAYQGFNYGATKADGYTAQVQSDFESLFKAAKNLKGTSGFNSARLYTMIQSGTTNTPISAIPAAIAEETSLLLGLWASGGGMDNELAALKSAIEQYGDDFTKLVVGISVGSEDLYRYSSEGQQVDAGVGIGPDELISYIKEVRSTISGTSLSGASIGHVDTWTAWYNGSNSAVIDEVDWVGFDGYPYFQNTESNSIDDAKALFDEAVAYTKEAAGDKEVWITETGWPVSGSTQNLAVANAANAQTYWDQVGCPLFGETNTWWYILEDQGASPSFGIIGSDLTDPLFNLTCSSSSVSSGSDVRSAVSSGAAATGSSVSSGASGSSSGSAASGSASGSAAAASGSAGAIATGASGAAATGFTYSSGPFRTGKGGHSFNSTGGFYNSSSIRPGSSSTLISSASGASATGSSGSSSSSSGSGSSSGSSSGSNAAGSASASSTVAPTSAATSLSGSVFGAIVAVCAFVAVL